MNLTAVISTDAGQKTSSVSEPVLRETAPGQQEVPLETSEPSHDDLPLALIVEDSTDVLLYLRSCLEAAYRLLTVENGQEGIDLVIGQVPDLIVSDVRCW